jgi:hypothetical protein
MCAQRDDAAVQFLLNPVEPRSGATGGPVAPTARFVGWIDAPAGHLPWISNPSGASGPTGMNSYCR